MTAALAMVVPASAQQPPVKVNVIHVCAPSPDEQKELSSALAKVPGKPAFSKDYEVSRGHSTLDPSIPIPAMQPLPSGVVSAADWVRNCLEFAEALGARKMIPQELARLGVGTATKQAAGTKKSP